MTDPQAGPSTGPRTRRVMAWKAGLGLIITLALFRFLFEFVDFEDLGVLFMNLRWGPWLLGWALWMGVYAARTVRFRLLAPRTPAGTMFWITSIHTILNRVLPFRTGELSYGILVKRAGTAGLGESLLGLLLLRIMDATTVVAVFSVTLVAWGGSYVGDHGLGLSVAAGAGVLGILAILALPRLLRAAMTMTRGLTVALRIDKIKTVARGLEGGVGAVDALARIGRPTLVRLGLISLVQWLLTFGAFYAILRAFSTPVGPAETVMGATASVVSGFLPIGGIGTFGTLEAGWAIGFVLVGLDEATAVATGFGVSLTTLGYSILPGLVGWWALGRQGKAQR